MRLKKKTQAKSVWFYGVICSHLFTPKKGHRFPTAAADRAVFGSFLRHFSGFRHQFRQRQVLVGVVRVPLKLGLFVFVVVVFVDSQVPSRAARAFHEALHLLTVVALVWFDSERTCRVPECHG